MPVLNANATMTFQDYQVTDTGTMLHFVCLAPGPDMPTDYYVFFTDAQIQAITSIPQAIAAVTSALQRKYRNAIATTLDKYIGQSVVI